MTRHGLTFEVLLGLVLATASVEAAPPAEPLPVLPQSAEETTLSVGLRAEASPVRREVAGFVGLSVPLERLAAPRRLVAPPEVPAVEAGSGPPPAAPPDAQRGESAADGPAPKGLDTRALSLLARGALAAARRAERAPHRERALHGLAVRARLSALLPEVRFRVARTRDESLRLTPTTDDPYRFTLAGGDALVLEGAATFRLSNLVFADDELAVERVRIERERNAERRIARVLERVLAWHSALVRLASLEEGAERIRLTLELEAAAVELDVLTGGWFGARVEVLGAAFSPPGSQAPPVPSAPPVTAQKPAETTRVPRLDPLRLSARPCEPCLPMHVTGSPTFKGASTR